VTQGSGDSKKSVKLELTEQQKKVLADAFGPEVVKRLSGIDVEQIAGYIKAEMHAN
jgi:hypothetical protein